MENKVLMSAVKKQGRTVTQHKSSKSYEFILLTRWETQRINEVRWRFICFEEVDQGMSFIMSCQFDEIFRTNQALAPFFSSWNNKRTFYKITKETRLVSVGIMTITFLWTILRQKKKETIEASWVRLRSMHFYLKSLKRHIHT